MKGLSSLIVEKYSVLLETNHEEQIPVDADHSMMCKFETDNDSTFEKVYKRIRRMKSNPRQITDEQPSSCDKYFEVPYLLSPMFTGRDKELQYLTESFGGPWAYGGFQRRFVLFGLGGSGKTQLCLKYTEAHRKRYFGIFWIDASSKESIQQGFTQIARVLQVDENVDGVKRKLANMSESWLLVFDNADDPQLGLEPYLPTGNRGDVIITSRNPQSQLYNTVGCREIGRLSPEDSMSLLYRIACGTTSSSLHTLEDCQKIVEALGYLALAIVQAGSYIRETSCSLHEYLEIYEERRDIVLQHLPKHHGTLYSHSVYTTWQVSIDKIASGQDQILSKQTLGLLKIICFYHYDLIPIQMFYNVWYLSQQDSQSQPDYLPWQGAALDLFDYQQSVQASLTSLASFSLIKRNADISFSLHPLVREWYRGRMPRDEQQLNYRRALSLLTNSVSGKFETEDYAFRHSLVSHVHELLRYQNDYGDISEEERIQELSVFSLIFAENGWIWHALQLTEEVVELRKSKLEEDHPDTLKSIHTLANYNSQAGRQTEALQLTEQVVKLYKSKLGEDHPDTLGSMHNLAIRYAGVGRQTEALQLMEEVVELYKNRLGNEHPDTL
ncbi:MAG: hypothetical protein Q9163_006061, partial [Psora crenata]